MVRVAHEALPSPLAPSSHPLSGGRAERRDFGFSVVLTAPTLAGRPGGRTRNLRVAVIREGAPMPIEVGQEATDFTLKDGEGEKVALSSFRGDKNVVLVFYPQAFSSVCTRQLTAIGEHEQRYAGEDAQVIGVSVDSRYVQRRFADELGLRDTIMLADFEPKGAVAK